MTYPSEKIWVRQLGSLFPTEWKNKSHVPNHQTVIDVLSSLITSWNVPQDHAVNHRFNYKDLLCKARMFSQGLFCMIPFGWNVGSSTSHEFCEINAFKGRHSRYKKNRLTRNTATLGRIVQGIEYDRPLLCKWLFLTLLIDWLVVDQPLWKIWVSWDHYSQLNGKIIQMFQSPPTRSP